MKKILSLATCALALTMTGCATNNKAPPAPKVVRSITLIPVPAPLGLSIENKGAPIAIVALAYAISNNSKSAEFNAQYLDYRKNMGAKLTNAIRTELSAKGFNVEIADSKDVVHDKDGELDYKKLLKHEAVLNVYFTDAGMYSGRATPHYLPMLDTYISLVNPSTKEYLIDTKYVHGAHARKADSWNIPSDPKFIFPSFTDLINQPNLVLEAYDDGLKKQAVHLAIDFAKQLVPAK